MEPIGQYGGTRPANEGPGRRQGDSYQRAHDQLDKLLAALREGKTTGASYLRIDSNQGGVTRVRYAIESE